MNSKTILEKLIPLVNEKLIAQHLNNFKNETWKVDTLYYIMCKTSNAIAGLAVAECNDEDIQRNKEAAIEMLKIHLVHVMIKIYCIDHPNLLEELNNLNDN